MSENSPAPFNDLLQKLGMELASAKAGSDQGQLAILEILSTLLKSIPKSPDAASVLALVGEAYRMMESIVEAGNPFSAGDLETLQSHQTKLMESLENANIRIPFGEPQRTAPKKPAPPAVGEEIPIVINFSADLELLREFVTESHERLVEIEGDLLKLEEYPKDVATMNSVFRSFHTFKGGSGYLNLTPINRLAHQLESLLDLLRTNRLDISTEVIELILQGKDALQQFIIEIEMQIKGVKLAAPIVVPTLGLLNRIASLLQSPESNPAPAFQSPSTETPEGAAAVGGKLSKVEMASIKVDVDKLDALMDQIGELVITQSIIAHNPAVSGEDNPKLKDQVARLFRISKQLQNTTLSMRMVPIRATFQKLTRMVRNISSRVGKKIQLNITGEDTELDRTIVEEVSDPLMHMISNAVDHGIERPEERVAAGKPEEGTLHLHAFHQGGNMVIQIKDDGAGLNRERILRKAREKKLIKPQAQLSDREIFHLIFEPGFSTAEVVTDISGRGVGMDVVRQNIEKLRGKIEIQSQEGVGSTFTISLPLTLAIIDGFIIAVGAQRYILPTLSVMRSFQIFPSMLSTYQERGMLVDVQGRQIPLLHLHEYLGVKARCTQPTDGVGVLIQADDQERCLLVDDLIGKQEIVIKGLGDLFQANHLLTGGAIMGDGTVGLILDVGALVQLKPTK